MPNFQLAERISPAQHAAQKGFPTTRYPIPVKKNLDRMVDWKSEHGRIGYSLGSKQHAHGDCLVFIQDILLNACVNDPQRYRVPKEAVSVSLAFDNFLVGKSYHEFVPRHMKIPADAFFSYKMFSKHVHVTYYNENGIEFLAGVCYFPQLKESLDIDTQTDWCAFMNCQWLANDYPLVNRGLTRGWIQKKRYGRFCESKGETVMVCVKAGSGQAVHYKYDFLKRETQFEPCSECEQELIDYKFETKKEVLPKASTTQTEPVTPSVDSDQEFDFMSDADINR